MKEMNDCNTLVQVWVFEGNVLYGLVARNLLLEAFIVGENCIY